jgi:hypothetical protein
MGRGKAGAANVPEILALRNAFDMRPRGLALRPSWNVIIALTPGEGAANPTAWCHKI